MLTPDYSAGATRCIGGLLPAFDRKELPLTLHRRDFSESCLYFRYNNLTFTSLRCGHRLEPLFLPAGTITVSALGKLSEFATDYPVMTRSAPN